MAYPEVTPDLLEVWIEPVSTLGRDELEHRYIEMKWTLERIYRQRESATV